MSARSIADEAARFAVRSRETALCVDFDGTLAPIVDDPERSEPLPGAIELLARLARRYAAVALISGRPAAFLAARAAASGVRYLGLYGLQEIRDGAVWIDPRLAGARASVAAATADLYASEPVRSSGAYVEDKEFAVAVHTRRLDDPASWSVAIDRAAREIAERYALEVIAGRLVWELRPGVRDDKGDAVRRVANESGARCAIVIGDDLGDVPAFDAATRLANQGWSVLRVAVGSDELPPSLRERADAIVDGPRGVFDFLTMLDERGGRP